MVIKSCNGCKFHEMRQDEVGPMSHCGRENCWSEYSKCIAKKALKTFLTMEGREEIGRSIRLGS
jgi:hypothetical protein